MKTKPWYQSLTVWGTAILTLCGLILPIMGQADLADFLQKENANILDVLAGIGGSIGAILTLIGRWRANKPLTLTKTPLIILLVAGLFFAGCNSQQTPSTKYVNTANFAADRFEEMAALIELDVFDQEEIEDIKFWTDQAKACLDEWYINIKVDPNGPQANFDAKDAYICVREALLQLLLYQEKAPPELQRQAAKQ